MKSYSIQINSRIGSDSFSLKKEYFKEFKIFEENINSDFPDTFPLSVIVFNEDIEDHQCMSIAMNIGLILKSDLKIEDSSKENQEKIKNLVTKGPYNDYPFVITETARTFIALSEMKYKNKIVMKCLSKISCDKTTNQSCSLLTASLKCKIYHCN